MTYLTLREIAKRERINYFTLRRWKIKSRVKEQRVGTIIQIRRSDVPKILRAGGR